MYINILLYSYMYYIYLLVYRVLCFDYVCICFWFFKIWLLYFLKVSYENVLKINEI